MTRSSSGQSRNRIVVFGRPSEPQSRRWRSNLGCYASAWTGTTRCFGAITLIDIAGLALGFDVDEQILKPVSYRKSRPALEKIDLEVANWLLFTKYLDWNYEQEARIFTALEDRDPATGLYFGNFGEQLQLREVIAGPLCAVGKQDLRDVTRYTTKVKFTKARLAFKTFRVVTDQRGFGGHR